MPGRGGDDGGDGGARRAVRDGATAVGEEEEEEIGRAGLGVGGGGLRENVLHLVVMATGRLTMLPPMLSQGIRQRRAVCVVQKVLGLRVG